MTENQYNTLLALIAAGFVSTHMRMRRDRKIMIAMGNVVAAHLNMVVQNKYDELFTEITRDFDK